MGIKTDIGLVGNDYQWLGSMFYFGSLARGPQEAAKVLTNCRISGLGVPDKPPAPTSATCQVLVLLHHHVGLGPLLHGERQELLGSGSGPFLPRGV